MKKNMKWKTTAIVLLAVSCTATALSGCAANEKQTEEPTVGQEISAEDMQPLKPTADEPMENDSVIDDISVHEPSISESAGESESQTEPSDAQESVSDPQTLYEQFLNNEIPATVHSAYPEADYAEPIIENGSSYTLTELGTCVSEYFLDPEYTDETSYDQMQYAYVECPDTSDPNDRNLLVKFIGLNIYAQGDDSYAVFVITEEDGELYLTDTYQCWARSETTAYANGTLRSFGSGGAGDHVDRLSVIRSDGRQETIYAAEILSGWWTSYVSDHIYNEIFSENTELNLVVSIYTIGGETYYQYDMSACSEDEKTLCENYINRCRDEQGIHWFTEEEIQTVIKEQCSAVGVDQGITQLSEAAVWNDLIV